MIQTIRIEHLLREAVSTPYRNLVTRPTGAAVRSRIEAELTRITCLTAVLDFSDIELLDLSCADEVVAKLLLASTGRPEPFLVLGWVREDQFEAIDHVLRHHGLAVAAVPACCGRPRLLGAVTPDAEATFGALCELPAVGADEIAARVGWDTDRAELALAELRRHRLVHVTSGNYRPVPIA